MAIDIKGRYANYYRGDKEKGRVDFTSKVSLNSIKVNMGIYYVKKLLTDKKLSFSNECWWELILVPGELNAEETARDSLKKKVVLASWKDLRESYPSIALEWLEVEADRLIAGVLPSSGPSSFLNRYLKEMGL